MPVAQDFECSLTELKERIDTYFTECDEKDRRYSDAGLCLALGLQLCRLQILSRLGDDYYGISPALRVDYRKKHNGEFAQWRHLELLKNALLRVQDQLAGRTDSSATFARKQPWLGGYTDKHAVSDATVTVAVKLDGTGEADAFG